MPNSAEQSACVPHNGGWLHQGEISLPLMPNSTIKLFCGWVMLDVSSESSDRISCLGLGALGGLVPAYVFLIRFSFLGGWQVFQ
jgi:hypothetical protein